MKQISWLRRLFWTWEKLEKYFRDYFEDARKNTNNQIQEMQKKHFDERISDLKENINDLKKNKEELVASIDEWKNRCANIEKDLVRQKTNLKNSEDKFSENENALQSLKEKFEKSETILREKRDENRRLQNEISDKLNPIAKIEKTFFDKSGSKGVGELGELQLKVLLEKSGLREDFWTENLLVNNKNVEFAMKSGKEGKYIPIDSKVITPELDEDQKPVIDKNYIAKIKTQAREMTKYLGKHNTESYGVLVLQSDNIYMNIYEMSPSLFRDVINDHKVYVASPSSFIQMAWSISEIVDIYERVKNDEKIYDQMISALNSVTKFANAMQATHKNFNVAMNSHFPALENKHSKLLKSLNKADKLKGIKQLELSKNIIKDI